MYANRMLIEKKSSYSVTNETEEHRKTTYLKVSLKDLASQINPSALKLSILDIHLEGKKQL